MLATSMKGGGFYNLHSLVQQAVIIQCLPLIRQAADRVPLPGESEPFTIIDYGCSEGANSVRVVKAMIGAVRERDPERAFCVVHDDLPTNNFNELFAHIYKDGGGSYLEAVPDNEKAAARTFVFLAGTSFYRQVVPASSVHLAFSGSAFHWMSAIPEGSVKNHVFHWGASSAERQRIARLAAEDWLTILTQRAKEMAPGARMVVTMPGSVSDADRPAVEESDTFSARRMVDLLNEVVCEMLGDGLIDRGRYEQFVFPGYMRSIDEIVAPVREPGAPLQDLLEVEQAFVKTMDCPYYADYQKTGDLAAYADELTATVRAFTEPMLAKGLFAREAGGECCPQELERVDEVYDRMKEQILRNPDKHKFNVVQTYTVIARR